MQRESLEFHIRENDYFGTAATVLDLIRQDLERNGYPRHAATLANLCQEFAELQRSYRIVDVAENQTSRLRDGVHLVSSLPGSIENRPYPRD